MAQRFLMEERDAQQLSPLQLAYMGDSVWEIIIRTRLIAQHMNVKHMHRECIAQVNAAAQAKSAGKIRPIMTEKETDVFLRGRNAHPHHAAPRHQDPVDYAEATGFEAVLGYLYLTGQDDRIEEMIHLILEETS